MKERLKAARKIMKLTQAEFGKRLGVTDGAISNLEKGERNLTDQMILAICKEYNINEAWLRNGVGEMFKEAATDQITHVADELGLDDLATTALRCYLKLDEPKRAVMRGYLQSLVNEYAELNPPNEE